MSNFCSNCGNKVSKSAQFCSNCSERNRAIKVELDIPKSINIDATIKKERRKKRKPIISKHVLLKLKNYLNCIKKIISKEIYLIIFKYSLFTIPFAILLNIIVIKVDNPDKYENPKKSLFDIVWCDMLHLNGKKDLTPPNHIFGYTRIFGYSVNRQYRYCWTGGGIMRFNCSLESRLAAVFIDSTIFIIGLKLLFHIIMTSFFPLIISIALSLKSWYIENSK
tara:strand:- start:46 stop:711 length:666 start_codon:yes stop_codon:yes gene_type:complete